MREMFISPAVRTTFAAASGEYFGEPNPAVLESKQETTAVASDRTARIDSGWSASAKSIFF